MGIKDVTFNKFVYHRPSVHFENNLYGDLDTLIYEATLNLDMTETSGTETTRLSGQTILKRMTQPDAVPDKLKESDYAPRTGSDLQGFWAGEVKAETNSWLLYFKIAGQPDGTFRAEVDGVIANVKDWIAMKERKPWESGCKKHTRQFCHLQPAIG